MQAVIDALRILYEALISVWSPIGEFAQKAFEATKDLFSFTL